MPEGPALYPEDYLTDQPQRVLVSETIREKVLHHTRDELPFSTAVVVDQYDEPDRPGGLLKVYCTIYVETDSQKPIVIGRAGSMIKQIGTEARKELEASLQCKVYLDLRVKVKAGLARRRARPGRPRPAQKAIAVGHAKRRRNTGGRRDQENLLKISPGLVLSCKNVVSGVHPLRGWNFSAPN